MSGINKEYLRRFLKIIGIIFIIFLVFYILILLPTRRMMTGTFLPAPNLRQVERTFEANREEFLIISEYFLNFDFDSFGVSSQSVFDFSRYNDAFIELSVWLEDDNIVVNDEAVSYAIQRIFDIGYRGIWQSGSGIIFTRWSMKDNARGIIYSIDGRTPDEDMILFLTELHPLSEENWFFFVENFSEWRRGIRPEY